MKQGGMAAMFYDLLRMDLGDWHPREIPESLLKGGALQGQQRFNLPPLEQWYLGLLHEGALPNAPSKRPNATFTESLIADAKAKVPRLKFDLTENALRDFLVDSERTGIVCTKYRTNVANGWSFPPLEECRQAWTKRYGKVAWDHSEVAEWGAKSERPKPKPPMPPA
jgi:hypothetical protein